LEPALVDEDRPNLAFNGLAALLLAKQMALAPDGTLDKLLAGVVAHRGIKLPQSNLSPQDNSLQAWSWIDTTFSWVEPTCWCLLALKKAAPRSETVNDRIDVAERLLRDRCCVAGGNDPVVVRSLEELKKLRLSERSAMALSLTTLAFALYGLDTRELEDGVLEQWDRTGFLGNVHLTAMAVYSLTHREHGISAFRI
jgi:hypothetical protein